MQNMGNGTGSHVNSTSSHVKGGIGSRQWSSRESAISNEHHAISCQQVSPYRGCKGVLAGLENLFKAWFLMTLLLRLRMRERGGLCDCSCSFLRCHKPLSFCTDSSSGAAEVEDRLAFTAQCMCPAVKAACLKGLALRQVGDRVMKI